MTFRGMSTQEANFFEREVLLNSVDTDTNDEADLELMDSLILHNRLPTPNPPLVEGNFLKRNYLLFKGLFFAFMSGVLLSLTSVTVKQLGDINPAELAAYRFFAIMIYTLPLVIRKQENLINKEFFHLLVFRAIFESFSIVFRYYCVQSLPLADANVIIFSSPVFVTIFARIFLKEKCSPVIVTTLFTTMIGLCLVVKIPLIIAYGDQMKGLTSAGRMAGVAYGFASVFFNAGCFIFIRKIKDVDHSVILFSLGWMASLGSGVITSAVDGFSLPRSCNYQAGVWVLLGLFSVFGQMFLTKALQLEQAGPISIVRSASDIVLAFFWQMLFFGEKADIYSISGAALVASGGIVLNVRKWLMSLPAGNAIRRKLWFLAI